ncbi:PKD domain-containing protein [Methanosphaerula palustris]|uniref:NHL repeat containing protein n=1 Tax=Methanosphaerula palustris (strain ATCC BAA-1556 / DSM 19958 / E1-9c) TaxID=521011 RepID=B8GI10_METPE|nr:PKD domain-containing protein [Methanosphaerula palustris]ACL16750.1 NHL repeat containing protein [Methanosphaerula palustris E1-9c]
MKSSYSLYIICVLFLLCSSVQVVSAEGGYAYATQWGSSGSGDEQFSSPSGVAVDSVGNVYVADVGNNRIQKFTSTGTFIKKWGSSGSGDGQFSSPSGVAVDSAGNVYVADTGNNRIQKFTSMGIFIKQWGSSGSGNGQFFSSPFGVAVDNAGNVYVADTGNNRIQKFTSDGAFVTNWWVNEPNGPDGVTVDSAGNVYVVDVSYIDRVQKFTSSGTFIAKFGSDYIHDSAMSYHTSVAVDNAGNVYFRGPVSGIQKFSSTGAPITKWGNYGSGMYYGPGDVAVDSTGNVYVSDTQNAQIVKFTPDIPLIPGFTATPTTGAAPLTVQFTDTTTGRPTSWYWNFGDGYASGAQNPSHLYSTAGTYSVTLTATNAVSGSKSITKTGYITVTEAPAITPVADFTATPSNGAAPLAIQFTDRSTNAKQWSWTFGDGTTSTEQHPSHTYTTAGTYTVVLTVRNAAGQSNTKTQTNLISVTSPVSETPAADFTATPTSGTGPLTVRFTDTSTGVPTGWYWFFGDGYCAFEKNPSHIFAQAGTYTVQLYTFNANGNSLKTKTDYITVSAVGGLNASFAATPTSGTAPLNVQFTDTSTGGATFWSWNFGDGAASTDQSPSHTYSLAGTYTTSLTVRNSSGLTSIKEGTITVTAPQQTLQAAFTINTQTVIAGQTTVTGIDTSTGSPATWYWDFGDGYASSARNINHVYTTAGSYTLSLTVTSGSQTSTTSKTITVTGESVITPLANFTVTPQGGVGSMGILVLDTSVNVTSVLYDLGDGTTTTYSNFRYTYWQPGTYTIKQTATSATGSSIKTITVTVPATNSPVSPTVTMTMTPTVSPTGTVSVTLTPTPTDQPQTRAASFNVSPTSGKRSFTTALIDTTTGGNPVSWKWTCGNGQSFSGKSVGLNRIWYNNAGTYTIILTVTDQDGSTRTATHTVTVL